VLLLLYPAGDSAAFILIERMPGGVHSGQIGLPGGKFEPADRTLERTALRETEEETGIDAGSVSMLGSLSRLYIPASGYTVYPQVGFLESMPRCSPNPAEVRRIIEARLDRFLDPGSRKTGVFETAYGRTEAPYFDYEGNRIWGATSMILSEFTELLR
jgi:8-oxo-dGTP pyrophosphatase MutT (NUDIX family)